jgi:hypothetical protein
MVLLMNESRNPFEIVQRVPLLHLKVLDLSVDLGRRHGIDLVD